MALKLVIDEGMRVQYPNFVILAEIILTYPASTAVVERGFSYINLTKSKFRNCLGSEHLGQLIRLRLNAIPLEKFPFHLSYKQWLDAKQRRYIASKVNFEELRCRVTSDRTFYLCEISVGEFEYFVSFVFNRLPNVSFLFRQSSDVAIGF